MDAAELMRLAIDKVREGIAAGQSPFGCAISMGDRVLAVEHNLVRLTTDITAHAEINALRTACRSVGRIHLEGAIVATTCEPCPMCISALHWARVDRVYYGATIADATSAGFNELAISASEMIRLGGSLVKLEGGLLQAECAALFAEWQAGSAARPY